MALMGLAVGTLIGAAVNAANQQPSQPATAPAGTWGGPSYVQTNPPGNMIAGGGPEAFAQAAAASSAQTTSTSFPASAVETALTEAVKNAKQTTIYQCVPGGGSCVMGADNRGTALKNKLQSEQTKLGLDNYTIEIGNTSGYQIYGEDGRASVHTYNTVTFRDNKTGKVTTYKADDYLGWTSVSKQSTPPRWSSPSGATNQELKHIIPPKSSGPSPTTTR